MLSRAKNLTVRSSPLIAVAILAAGLCSTAELTAAGKYTLAEPTNDARVFRVSLELRVSGQLETAIRENKTLSLELKVQATHRYLERRLSGTGRAAAALRTLRHYDAAQADIEVAGRSTSSRLQNNRRRIVAQGRRDGVEMHSPSGRLSGNDVELLQTPGDSLTILALLPPNPVDVGESWEPESWVVQMLSSTEAVLKSHFTCQLDAVTKNVAKVTYSGKIEGATAGALTKIDISGFYLFDLKERCITRVELIQKEKRSIGTVSPGMKVEARAVLERSPANSPGPLTDAAVESIPLEPDQSLMRLVLETPWRIRLHHDRDWHLYLMSGDSAALRMLAGGSLIAQCNVTRIPPAAVGKHTSEKQFQLDIHKALGDRLESITKAEQLEVPDKRFLYRVTAVGKSNGIDMHWYYYLCASPSGRQTTFVFAVETKLIPRLKNCDLEIVSKLEFLGDN